MLPVLPLIITAMTGTVWGQVLVPPYTNLALGKKIEASSTCGELNGQPIKEIYCQIAGSNQYTPLNQYSYSTGEDGPSVIAELRMGKQSFVQGGQICDFCQANSSFAHPATNMVDGRASWWQSPPLSRGIQYNQVNISIDLGQEFHVAYVWIQMANSPRPGSWVLERSVDGGKTYLPWQYFAETPAECDRIFGRHTLQPLLDDDTVICTHEYAGIHPMDNAEIMINLLENRPGKHNFSHSEVLQNFTRATNVRLRLLRTKTLHGHLMDVNRRDPTVTRRYFYAIKEIFMGGRCVCNGHADTCDILDVRRSNILLCRCEHNTCGDHCERCCPGFEQKRWRRSKDGAEFVCEPCNCHGHSEECVYEWELERTHASLDINGNYDGGGRCLNCRDNTEGINCNKCIFGYYRPQGKLWDEVDVCQPCICDPTKHTGRCEDETALCECKPQFTGINCDHCAPGYYAPPECKPCDCSVNGTLDNTCLPIDGHCPCKSNYDGMYCQSCAPGYTLLTAGCIPCECDELGSLHNNCDENTTRCVCKTNFVGVICDSCADGYFSYPLCEYCDCDASGTEDDICDKKTGACLCKPGFSGPRCDTCDKNFYGYPHCKECNCNEYGSKSTECDRKTGDCLCYTNFTSKKCDRCAAGFYDYPNCKPCSCLASGSKGMTCDSSGQCYCKPNFQGERCDQCKTNFYNFPICEECNCDPKGVVPSFAGCDKVAPGELCTCKKHVMGRICNQCRPTYWDLQYHHEGGCVKCECNSAGTVSDLNECSLLEGHCYCKKHVTGHKCDKCLDGFFQLEAHNQLGCQACNCDIGGALGVSCDMQTGDCRCRPRITGQKCNRPIENHYFPTLWHNKYEAEDGMSMENRPVRFSIDKDRFANYSWRGYAVFSPVQEDILLDVMVTKASLYRLLFHYVNPTTVQIDVRTAVIPLFTHTQDVDQTITLSLSPTFEPTTVTINPKQPFVLNPGKWSIKISTKQRLFLDYVVLLPAEYYEGTLLKERFFEPCEVQSNATCSDYLYPPLPVASRVDVIAQQSTTNGNIQPIEKVLAEILPSSTGEGIFGRINNRSRKIHISLKVPEDDNYSLILEYRNAESRVIPITLEIKQYGQQEVKGNIVLKECPYLTFCREVLSFRGSVAFVFLKKGDVSFTIDFESEHVFGLASVNLIRSKEWNVNYLQQTPVCVRRNGHCVNQWFPPAPNAILNEIESQMKSISGKKLPFVIANPEDVEVVALDENMGTIEVSGVVPSRDHYVFIVQYFNPDNTPLTVNVTLQNGHFYYAEMLFTYCPSVIGCRGVIRDKGRPYSIKFLIDDKYTAAFYFNESQKGALYIDSITSLPFHSYSDTLLTPLSVDVSNEYMQECGINNFKNDPLTVSEYCRRKVFSLTSEYNMAAFPCECHSQGSTSFTCEEYGGDCSCRPNIIGRRCDRCAPGYYGFPDCIKCRCPDNHLCDELTGQCFCPPHVEGKHCDRCVPYAFGYDPLIGCQPCGCHQNGSEAGQLQCDSDSGQCLCQANVGGRKCDKCLPGFYGFPHCYECTCEVKGTTEEICEATDATCKCKKNVIGENCDSCRPGTFNLRATNPDGCAECFCFGATDRCRSSFLPITYVNFDEEAWKVYPRGSVLHSHGEVVYRAEGDVAEDAYFLVPLGSDHDFTTSYGLQLSFTISSNPQHSGSKMSSSPDVQLIGNNTILDFWAREQQADPRIPFSVEIKLLPENFMDSTGKPTTRDILMMVLNDLAELRLKACYHTNCESATITNLQLEIARDEQSIGNSYTAASVEMCHCPSPYTGLSCQHCSPGYYRVNSGRYLGACVPCSCNGHSGSCNPATGICFDCQHDTVGEHCEFCREGFYGNATKGGPYSCMPCACPYATDTNNFALSCQVSETGFLESCSCKEGYTSNHCERCDIGYYGQPKVPGGFCQKCNCNNNNDLSVDGSCHPVSGDCDLCLNNTYGAHCESCKPWFYGDAITAKNCTSCKCNQCGSSLCDNKYGHCECYPNVEGKYCDRCVANAWGFSRCHGCVMCNCALASSSPQCDPETGQCSCMPGAAGQMCEVCEHGYWNYGPTGCFKCDCEADLSLGTVCDVLTGQCHCQEGAIGSRCNECAPQYLRITNFGCRLCDECVHSVVYDLDELSSIIDFVGGTINNVSTTAVMGARLKRLDNHITNLKPTAVNYTGSASNLSIENLSDSVFDALNDVASTIIRANRYYNAFESLSSVLFGIANKTSNFSLDAFDRVEVAASVVDSLKILAFSLGKDSSSVNHQKWLLDSAALLLQIRNVTNGKTTQDKAEKSDIEMKKLLGRIQEQKLHDVIHEKVVDIRNGINRLVNTVTEYKSFLLRVASLSENTIERMSNTSKLFGVNSALAGISAGEIKIKEMLKNISILKTISEFSIESSKYLNKTLYEVLTRFQNTFDRKSAKYDSIHLRPIRDVMQDDYAKKSEKLENEAIRLSFLFDRTRSEAKNAVAAAIGYKELMEILKKARDVANEAFENADEAKMSYGLGKMTSARIFREQSVNLLQSAINLKQSDVNDLVRMKAAVSNKTLKLQGVLEKQKNAVEFLRPKIDEELGVKVEYSLLASEQVRAKIDNATTIYEHFKRDLEEMTKQSIKIIGSTSHAANNLSTAKEQILKLESESSPVQGELKTLSEIASNTSTGLQQFREKLSSLKEKIASARDLANRIRLGAHFEKGSNLELPLPSRITRSAAYTKIEFFFRTTNLSGLVLFLGNELDVAGTRAVPTDDFIAVEVKDGYLRVVVNLGEAPAYIISDSFVADGNWRKVGVEHIGKRVKLQLSPPNSANYEELKLGNVAGTKSLFNLHQKKSRLFVGGIAPTINISSDVHSREFSGDFEDLHIHGELIGLWNAKNGGSHNIKGAAKKLTADSSSTDEIALSFNGNGFAAYKFGMWNPRKQTVFSLTFQTYSPEGLLLYLGKNHDFLSLQLQDGLVKLSFDFGSGVGSLVSAGTRYNDGKPHSVYVYRIGQHARIQVDENDIVEGDSPGTMFELSVSDVFYLGGVPSDVPLRTTVVPMTGCLEHLKLDNYLVDLSQSRNVRGVQPGCSFRTVHIITLISERSTAVFSGFSVVRDTVELAVQFKTKRPSGVLATVSSAEQGTLLQLCYENGFISATYGSNIKDVVKMEFRLAADGQWHYAVVSVKPEIIRLDVDDLHSNETLRTVTDKEVIGVPVSVHFGQAPDSDLYFEGCIGDATYNGQLLDFAEAVTKEVRLTSCLLPEDMSAAIYKSKVITAAESMPASFSESDSLRIPMAKSAKEPTVENEMSMKTPKLSVLKGSIRNPHECALLKSSYGERPDSGGIRFGLSTSSRLEFDKPPASFDKNSIFSVQLRATASNGIIMFTTNNKHTDHIALYLVNGIVHFAYNSGSGQAVLSATRSVMDDEWHSIRAEREGTAGTLYIDNVIEANGQSPPGTDAVDTHPPIYIGGLPADLVPFASRILPGARSVFGGCLRDFKLNEMKFDVPPAEIGTVPCHQFTEEGLYFGHLGGYAILSKNLRVGSSFNMELEVRPRTKSGVLLSVGILEYLTLHFSNGTVKFTVDNGAGPEVLSHTPSISNALCDGHWHHIKLYKTKNLMTLTVDGRSSLNIMKKGKKTDTNTMDPLYLGGVPKGTKPRGLETTEGYVGCLRILNMGKKPRKRKNVDISQVPLFGDVTRDSCPVN